MFEVFDEMALAGFSVSYEENVVPSSQVSTYEFPVEVADPSRLARYGEQSYKVRAPSRGVPVSIDLQVKDAQVIVDGAIQEHERLGNYGKFVAKRSNGFTHIVPHSNALLDALVVVECSSGAAGGLQEDVRAGCEFFDYLQALASALTEVAGFPVELPRSRRAAMRDESAAHLPDHGVARRLLVRFLEDAFPKPTSFFLTWDPEREVFYLGFVPVFTRGRLQDP